MINKNIQLLKKSLQNSTIFQEYYNLKEQIKNSESLNDMKKRLNELKQSMTKNVGDSVKHAQYAEEYTNLIKEYNNHPLIQNFEYVKEEVENELNFIREQLTQ